MNVKDVVAKRFSELCQQRNIKINELANRILLLESFSALPILIVWSRKSDSIYLVKIKPPKTFSFRWFVLFANLCWSILFPIFFKENPG